MYYLVVARSRVLRYAGTAYGYCTRTGGILIFSVHPYNYKLESC